MIMVGLIKICVNMDEEKKQRKTKGRDNQKEREREREKSTDIGLVCGSHKQLKNIEWWQVSDGAKRGGG